MGVEEAEGAAGAAGVAEEERGDKMMIDRRTTSMPRWLTALVGLALGSVACNGEGHIQVYAFAEHDAPLVGVEIMALPFDPDRMLDSLAQASAAVKPVFPELQAEMAAYVRPEEAVLRGIGAAWLDAMDEVKHLADSLNRVSPRSSGYAAAYDRLRMQYRQLAQRAVDRDREFREHMGDDRDLASRASAAADSLRRWENEAFAAFPELADSALARSGRPVHRDETDTAGKVRFTLSSGRWWLIVRWNDPDNPFTEHYWNVALRMSVLGPRKIQLYAENSTPRWRH